MKNIKILKLFPLVVFLFFIISSFTTKATTYKCMIQMTNYSGEGAYIAISLLNPVGEYEKTLYVQGDDDEWYFDITEWWQFQGKTRINIDAVTGATLSGGSRTISILSIEDNKIDTGYKIRFESAVEDQDYYKDDVEFELTSETIKSTTNGKGFIRYVRMMPNK